MSVVSELDKPGNKTYFIDTNYVTFGEIAKYP